MESETSGKALLTVVVVAVPAIWLALQIYQSIHNIFFHPLKQFPGPLACKASPIPAISQTLTGNFISWLSDLHQQYGDVVRYTPNELSFASAGAYNEIYGHKAVSQRLLVKDPKFYDKPPGEAHDIISSEGADHQRMRRILSHAFSDRALKAQESLFLKHADNFVSKIREELSSEPQTKFNMVDLFTFFTFDTMSDLAFGDPLNLLKDSTYHHWIHSVYSVFTFAAYYQSARYYAIAESIFLRYFMPKSVAETRQISHDMSRERVNRRLADLTPRSDIWGLILERDDASGLAKDEMYANGVAFMIAGSDTTATLLSGLLFYLLQNAEIMGKLTDEIRSSFTQEKDISIERLQTLKYLQACIEEGLRMYPPVPAAMPRKTLAPIVVDGMEVPPGVSIGVTTRCAFRNPRNFVQPNEFHPERWLGDPRFDDDNKQAFNPFLTGPRGCLGRNMAYHEMRLVVAKLLFNFDFTLAPESQEWDKQKIFLAWSKGPLLCYATPVTR